MPYDAGFVCLWIVLFACTGGMFAYCGFMDTRYEGYKVKTVVTGCIFFAAVVFWFFGACTASSELLDEQTEVLETHALASTGGGSRIEGSFSGGFLSGTSGSIEETEGYTLMVEQEDGIFKKERIDAEDAEVVYDAGEGEARVEEVRVTRRYRVERPYLLMTSSYEVTEAERLTRIHVPEESAGEYIVN